MRYDICILEHSIRRMHTLSCPYCGKRAISLIHKMMLTHKQPVACDSCGKGVGVSSSVTGAYMPPLVLVTLSGYVENYVIKFLIWGLAIVVFAITYLYRLPLEPKDLSAPGTKIPGWITAWLMFVFLGFIATWNVNFFPSRAVSLIGLPLSVILSFPIVQHYWKQDHDPGQKLLAYGFGYALLATIHFQFIAIAIPAAPAALFGQERVVQASIHSKHTSYKVLRCNWSLQLNGIGVFLKKEVCVTETEWLKAKKGDPVSVVAIHSWFGDFVTNVIDHKRLPAN